MSDRVSLLALDAPVLDKERLRPRTGVDKPVETPSLWSQFSTATLGAAANDDPEAAPARQKEALDAALAPIVAELERRGIRTGDYTARHARDGFALSYNEDAIWQGIARARALDEKAFAGVDPSPDAFRKRVAAPVLARIAGEQEAQANSSWLPWLAGKFVGGAADPINQAGMLAGIGPARSILGAAIRDAGINVKTELMQEPVKAIANAKRGKETSIGDVATNLAIAAGTGAIGGAVLHGVGDLVKGRAKTPSGAMADEVLSKLGGENLTDEERAAVTLLDHVDEVSATSPFTPGAGTDAHIARMDAAAATLERGPGAAPSPPPAPRFDLNDYGNRVGRHESGGRWDAQASGSSAYGFYQITKPTFVRYARQDPSFAGMTDEAIWLRRTNPAFQERIFKRITADNRAALANAGAPETYGNLYLMHFAGEHGGTKILRAAPDTPIEQILTGDAIRANPFLKGKTAGEVIEWAHHAVGDTVHAGPVLRRDQFDSDDAWADAQREVDAIDAASETRLRAEPSPWGGDTLPISGFDEPALVGEVRPVGSDWEPGAPRSPAEPGSTGVPRETIAGVSQLPVPREATGYVPQAAQRKWTAAVEQLQAQREGEVPGALWHRETGPIDLKWGSAGTGKSDGFGLAKIVEHHPEVIDRLPALLDEMHVVSRSRNRVKLESATHDASVRLDWDGERQTWLMTAYEKNAPATPVDARDVADGRASPDHGAPPDIAAEGAPGKVINGGHPTSRPIEGFDHADDVAAQRQLESLEHDLRMELRAEDGDLQVRLDEDGKPVSARDALAELDADEAAIDAARACMAPPADPEVPF